MKQWINRYGYQSIIGLIGVIEASSFLSPIVTLVLVLIALGLTVHHYRETTKKLHKLNQALASKKMRLQI